MKNKIYTLLIIFSTTLALLGCEDEIPMVQKVSNLDAYVGDWQGQQVITIKNDASGDTVALEETLRLIADSPTSGRFEIVDTTATVTDEGTFTVSEVTNSEVSIDPPRLLRLISLVEDSDDSYEQEVNGENVYYDYQTFNIREISANRLVLTDATSESDLVMYSYTK